MKFLTSAVAILVATTLATSGQVLAQTSKKADRSAAEAMVKKGVEAFKSSGWEAFIQMTAPSKAFVDRDLYLDVYDLNGKCKAHGQNFKQVGKRSLNLKDSDGKLYIKERVELAKESKVFWQEYKSTSSLTNLVQDKQAYCELVDQIIICGSVQK